MLSSALLTQDKGGYHTIGCRSVGRLGGPSEAIRKVENWKGKLWMRMLWNWKELGGNTCVCERIRATFNGGCGAPLYGDYRPTKRTTERMNFPPSL